MTVRLSLSLATALALTLGLTPASAQDLVAYRVVDDIEIPAPLTAEPGDPERGREVAIDRKLGNCLACHSLPAPEQAFHGEIGPDLAGVAGRMSAGEVRLRVVDPKRINEATMMPAFYRTEGLHRVMDEFKDEPILTVQQVEDVIAYLMTLTEN